MRRKRRTKYTWLPTIGTGGNTGDGIDNVSGRQFALTVNETGATSVVIGDLTFDNPHEGDDLNAQSALTDIVGNEYFLRRIVGKLYIEHNGIHSANGDPSTPTAALVGAGFFIARAGDSDTGGQALPIGAQETAGGVLGVQESYNPLAEDCIREPWIWRRVWILRNGGLPAQGTNPSVITTSGTANGRPNNTYDFGSVLDGPHIDAKTARRVRQDERLWFVVACTKWPLQEAPVDTTSSLQGYLDYRILGALRKAKNRGSF